MENQKRSVSCIKYKIKNGGWQLFCQFELISEKSFIYFFISFYFIFWSSTKTFSHICRNIHLRQKAIKADVFALMLGITTLEYPIVCT